MKRSAPAVLALVAALGLGFAPAAAADSTATPPGVVNPAAAQATYISTTSSPLIGLGTILGLFTVTGFGGTTYTPPVGFGAGDITAPVVGNPLVSQRVVQQGGVTLTKPDGSTLTIRSIIYDVKAGQVTGVIGDYGRVVLYDAVKVSDTEATLTYNPQGAAITRNFLNAFGLPVDNSYFGTAHLIQTN